MDKQRYYIKEGLSWVGLLCFVGILMTLLLGISTHKLLVLRATTNDHRFDTIDACNYRNETRMARIEMAIRELSLIIRQHAK